MNDLERMKKSTNYMNVLNMVGMDLNTAIEYAGYHDYDLGVLKPGDWRNVLPRRTAKKTNMRKSNKLWVIIDNKNQVSEIIRN